MESKKISLFSATLALPSVVIVGLLAYLGTFSQLMADDFCVIQTANRLGILRSVWGSYLGWHGGYSTSFADGLVLGLFGQASASFAPPVTVALWIIALAWALRSFLQNAERRPSFWQTVSLSLAVLCVTFLLSPAIKTSLLWWNGLRGYIPPLVIFPFYVGVYFYFSKRTWTKKKLALWYLVGFAIIFFNSGFNETFTPVQLAAFCLWVAWAFITKQFSNQKEKAFFIAAGLVGAAVGLTTMVLAPGNSHRQAFFPAPPSPFGILAIAWNSFVSFTIDLLSVPEKSAALIGVALAGILFGSLITQRRENKITDALLLLATGLTLAFCCFPPAAYGQSTAPSEHTLIIPIYIFTLTILIVGVIVGQSFALTLNARKTVPIILLVVMFLALGFSVAAPAQKYYADIPKAAMYAKQWQSRDAQIRTAKSAGQNIVYFRPIENWMGVLEPSERPLFFVNYCMRKYYGITVISGRPPQK